jgi:AcrR family transcriptional regulator
MATATKKSAAKGDAVAPATRRPRADAARNRVLIVAAAMDAFRELGLDASVAEIARRAGVGTGTLFRNFPSKDDLISAVVETKMNEWSEAAELAIAEPDAAKAFEQFMFAAADAQMSDRGLAEAIKQHIIDRPELHACKMQALGLTNEILKRAQKAGAVRGDVVTEDLRYLINAAISSDPLPGNEDKQLYRRYLRIMLDGLRPDGSSKLDVKAPD